jgi:hypothetical protein
MASPFFVETKQSSLFRWLSFLLDGFFLISFNSLDNILSNGIGAFGGFRPCLYFF